MGGGMEVVWPTAEKEVSAKGKKQYTGHSGLIAPRMLDIDTEKKKENSHYQFC